MTNGKIVFLAVPVYSECWIMLPLNFLGKSNNIFWPLKTFRKILWVPDDYPPKKKTQTKLAKPNKLVRDFQIQERQLFCTLTCHCGTLLHFIRRKKSCELCLGSYSYCIWLNFGHKTVVVGCVKKPYKINYLHTSDLQLCLGDIRRKNSKKWLSHCWIVDERIFVLDMLMMLDIIRAYRFEELKPPNKSWSIARKQ